MKRRACLACNPHARIGYPLYQLAQARGNGNAHFRGVEMSKECFVQQIAFVVQPAQWDEAAGMLPAVPATKFLTTLRVLLQSLIKAVSGEFDLATVYKLQLSRMNIRKIENLENCVNLQVCLFGLSSWRAVYLCCCVQRSVCNRWHWEGVQSITAPQTDERSCTTYAHGSAHAAVHMKTEHCSLGCTKPMRRTRF